MSTVTWIGMGLGAVVTIVVVIRGALYFVDKYLRDMGEM